MSEPNNDRQHLTDHTKEFKSDIANGPLRIPFKTFPADRISDDKTVADRIYNAEIMMQEKCAKAAEDVTCEFDGPAPPVQGWDLVKMGVESAKQAIAEKIRNLK